jgi:hypothetical protein
MEKLTHPEQTRGSDGKNNQDAKYRIEFDSKEGTDRVEKD